MTIEANDENSGQDPFDFSDICSALRDDTTAEKVDRLIGADEAGIEVRLTDEITGYLGSLGTGSTEITPLKSNFHSMRGH